MKTHEALSLCSPLLERLREAGINSVFPMEKIADAVKRASENSRTGKVMIEF